MKTIEKGLEKGYEIEVICTGTGNGGGGCNRKILISSRDIKHAQKCTAETELCAKGSFVACKNFGFFEWVYFFKFNNEECGMLTNIDPKKIPIQIRKKIKIRENNK